MFFIMPILSLTLAPPSITANGFSGLFIATFKFFNSSSIKNPIPLGKYEEIPTLEAWLLCEVPNASLINISPKDAQYFPKSSSLPDSFLPSKSSNLVFSISNTSPHFKLSIALKVFFYEVSH